MPRRLALLRTTPRTVFRASAFLASTAVALVAIASAIGQDLGTVSIQLVPDAVVDTDVVFLRQIASIEAGASRLSDLVRAIDLADLPNNGQNVILTRRQIQMRLRLAGFDDSRIQFSGATSVRVRKRTSAGNFLPVGRVQPATFRDTPPASTENPVIIRARDAVRVYTKLPAATLSVQGEALQDGRLGQMIRVLNARSKQIVIGRVREDGRVEVER